MALWKIVSTFTISSEGNQTSKQIPTFWVEAISESEAHAIARDVIGIGRPSSYARAHASSFVIDAIEDTDRDTHLSDRCADCGSRWILKGSSLCTNCIDVRVSKSKGLQKLQALLKSQAIRRERNGWNEK